jgi:hypothetical protein
MTGLRWNDQAFAGMTGTAWEITLNPIPQTLDPSPPYDKMESGMGSQVEDFAG